MNNRFARGVLFVLVVWILGLAVTLGAARPGGASPPPDLEFIYHDDWWSANSFSAEAATYRTVAGDFNGDSRDDIAMAHRTNSTTVRFYVLLGADDHFSFQGIWLEISGFLNADMMTGRVVAGDFNNDGFDDVAAFAGNVATNAYVFLSDGSSFSNHVWWGGDLSYQDAITGRVVAGDFDGDGWEDDIAALYDTGGDSIRADVFLSDGSDFSYQEDWWSIATFIPDNASYRTVAGDMDADGDDDIVMVYEYAASETHVHVLRSSGSAFTYLPRWWESTSYIADRTTGRVVAGDFDGDGDDDVALLYDYLNSDTRGHVLLSTREAFSYQGVPGWWEHLAYTADFATGRVVAGDWDADGVDDVGMIYRATSSSSRAQVLEATAPAPQPPATRQVDADDPGCSDAGGAPFCTIQAAVDAANNGDTIQVAAGGYFERVGLPKYADPGFNQALTVQGAGAASTFVDGGGASGPVFTIHPGGQVNLNDFTIQNGGTKLIGGGVHNGGGQLTVSDVTVSGNRAAGSGGGIGSEGGATIVRDSTVSGNTAFGSGGGLASEGGAMAVINSIISGNVVSETFAVGGGIASTGELTVMDSVISDNIAAYSGGGLSGEGSVMIVDSVISHNTVTATIGTGGGIAISGTLSVEYSTLSDNASYGGAGIFVWASSGVLMLKDSTLSGNTATYAGAGIIATGVVTLSNSTISANAAGDVGGGLYVVGTDSVSIHSTTFSDNTAGDLGDGIYNAVNGTVTLANSIVANNASGGDCAGEGSWETAGAINLNGDGTCPGFTLTGDPLLGPLEDNGGSTQTHALLDGSPAIDAGSNAFCPGTDQRGVLRPQDGDDDGVAVCDLGAYEVGERFLYLPIIRRP